MPNAIPTTPMTQVVGVDIGGTKTHVATASPNRREGDLAEFIVPSSWRPSLGDFATDARGLRDLLVSRIGERVIDLPLVVGAHGCDSTDQCRTLERELRRYFSGPVIALNDSELMGPAMGCTSATGLVVGTGSIATARDDRGELMTSGGWGWLLGDEGSAAGLVRDAVRAVLTALDEGERLDPLGHRLLAAFEAQDGPELALVVSTGGSAESWGRHAPEVFDAAGEGSKIARCLIDRAAEDLARLVSRLRARGAAADVVVAGGSVIQNQARLQDALRSALVRDHPATSLLVLDRPPVYGAISIARCLREGSHISSL